MQPIPTARIIGIVALVCLLLPATAKKRPPLIESKDTTVYDRHTIAQMPRFKGKEALVSFPQWIGTQLQYPETLQQQGLGGRVVVRFVIEQNGDLSNVEILESPYLLLSAEVIRVLGLSPRWTPGINAEGEAVRTWMVIPVRFTCIEPRKDKSLPPQLRQGQHAL